MTFAIRDIRVSDTDGFKVVYLRSCLAALTTPTAPTNKLDLTESPPPEPSKQIDNEYLQENGDIRD